MSLRKPKCFWSGLLMTCLVVGIGGYLLEGYLLESSVENPEIRTVTYTDRIISDESLLEEFDSHLVEETNDGFVITAIKAISASHFDEVDLVDLNYDGVVDIDYTIQFIESQSKIILNISTEEDGMVFFESFEGIVTFNEAGDLDALFADGERAIWLSDLVDNALLDQVGFWDWLVGVAKAIVNAIVLGFRAAVSIVVKIVGLDNASKVLSMYKDTYGDYHADFDAWQTIGGYNDLYDFVFKLGSSMLPDKNAFYDENKDGYTDYILWGWKGDYWSLGAGAELGIYRRLGKTEHWYVDKNLAVDMTLKLERRNNSSSSWATIIDWNPKTYFANDSSKQKSWWITGFDPEFVGKNTVYSNLRATFTVEFVTKGYSTTVDNNLRNEFRNTWGDKGNKKWTYNTSTQFFSYTY